MAVKGKPYELFGSFLLFKKLESDQLSESWRAGEIVEGSIQNTVILRRFTGGDREAFKLAAEHARSVVAAVTGSTILRGQKIGFVSGTPYLAHEYPGGRSLRTIVDKGRAANHPIPLDQALSIVEKLALSVETLANMRYQGAKVAHGALIPQFIWVNDEGEVRTAGQQFGRGILFSLRQPEIAKEFAGYFAPELRGGDGSKSADVYSLGAILYLLLTGLEPPESGVAAVVGQALQNAKLANREEPIPADIRPILDKSLNVDPSQRYALATDMRQALDKLLNAGEYTPTTFNLAFYLNTLLRKEMEVEQHERQQEGSVDVASYTQPMVAAPVPAPVPPPRETSAAAFSSAPFAATAEPPAKSKAPLIAAGVLLAVAGIGAAVYFAMSAKKPSQSAAATTTAPVAPPTTTSAPIEPIIVAGDTAATSTALTTTAAVDPEARKKAIQLAVDKRMQEEMAKLQEQYNRQLQQKKVMEPSPAPAPATTASAARPTSAQARPEAPAPSAALLDQQRRAAAEKSAPATSTAAVQNPAPAVAAPATARPATPTVQEGDVVAYNDLDSVPELRSPVRPVYPPAALKKRSEGSVLVTALIAETGRVVDVKVLRGDTSRSGFDDAAIRAVRAASFSAPMKNGKRVKTWKPLPIVFRLQ